MSYYNNFSGGKMCSSPDHSRRKKQFLYSKSALHNGRQNGYEQKQGGHGSINIDSYQSNLTHDQSTDYQIYAGGYPLYLK